MPGEVSLVKAVPGAAAKSKVKTEPFPPIPKPDAVAMAKKLKRLICQVRTRSATQQEKRDLFCTTYSPRPSSQLQRSPET